MKREPIPHTASIVKYNLANGKTTAQSIADATGLAIEAVYTALVWLEARGMAFLSTSMKDRKKHIRRWETQ